MSNRIIKVSILLIFMMFVTGLFNFCFALTLDPSYFIDVDFKDYGVKQFSPDTIDMSSISSTNLSYVNSYIDTPDGFDLLYFEYYSSYRVALHDIQKGDKQDYFCYKSSWLRCSRGSYQGSVHIFQYNFDKGLWESYEAGASTLTNELPAKIGTWSTANIYSSGSNTSTLLYEANELIVEPTEEEIRQQFDFKINIDFQKTLENETYIDRTDGYSALITHSLIGWEDYYKVEVDVTNSQTGVWNSWSNRYYLDYYDKNNSLLEEKLYIKGEGGTNWYHFNMQEGDYFTIFSKANNVQLVTLYYKIYNKSDNILLASRKVSFMFDTDYDPIRETLSGHISFDEYKDSDGNDISENKDSVVTNGTNRVEQEFSQDNIDNILNNYNNKTDLNSLVSNAKDTVNVFQICFNMLPSFIWVMIGTFLSIVIALRILGR